MIFVVFITLSCNNKTSTKIITYKINSLKSNFSLPNRFESISGNKLIELLGTQIGSPSTIVKDKMNKKQVHFIDYDSEDVVTIIPFPERLPIEKLFLNSFADMVEEGTFKKLNKDYELVEKRYIKSNNNNSSFKIKFKYPTKISNKYSTTYLLTTKEESLMVLVHSFDNYDMQNMIVMYLDKN